MTLSTIFSVPTLQTAAGLTVPELAASLESLPDAALRAKQIAKHLYSNRADDYAQMTDVPLALRAHLESALPIWGLRVVRSQKAADGVVKLLLDRGDGEGFECVLLPFERRVSCCLSTQVGCAMGCTFCATGLGGFDRNLTRQEIVEQYLMLQRESDRRISHIVFMGMGEPLLNFENLMEAMALFHGEIGISYRHMTVSTVGIVPQILALADRALPVNLAISLHSPHDAVRSGLMPVNRKWNVAELMTASRTYVAQTGRKVTFEYLLIDRVTDTLDQANELARLIRGMPCLVNLIPFNPVATPDGFQAPSRNRIRAFRSALEAGGVNVSQRMEKGQQIDAACGQLAGMHAGRFARRTKDADSPVFRLSC